MPAAQLFRTDDIISLDPFNQQLLATMLQETVASPLTSSQARELVARARAAAPENPLYAALLETYLIELDALINHRAPKGSAR